MTQAKNDGERLVALETNMGNIEKRLAGIESSMSALHGKFDLISNSYVAKETFEEYKKNRWMDRVIVALVTAIVSGLVAFFLRENNI